MRSAPFHLLLTGRNNWRGVSLGVLVVLISIARNCDLLYLGAALNNFHHPGITEVALYRVLAATAQRAVNLYGITGGFHGSSRGEILGDKCLHHGSRVTFVLKG